MKRTQHKRKISLSGFSEIDDDFVIDSKTPKRQRLKSGNSSTTSKKKKKSHSRLSFSSTGKKAPVPKSMCTNSDITSKESSDNVIEIDSDSN